MHSEEKKSTFSFVTCSSSFCGFNVHLLVQNPDGFSACTASKPVIELLLKSVLKQLPIIERKLRFRTWYMHSRTFKPKARVEENVFAIVSRKVYTHVCLLHPRHSLFFLVCRRTEGEAFCSTVVLHIRQLLHCHFFVESLRP